MVLIEHQIDREERYESSLLSELKYENLLYIEHPKKGVSNPWENFFLEISVVFPIRSSYNNTVMSNKDKTHWVYDPGGLV